MVDCKDIAQTLLDCLRETECMRGGRPAKECVGPEDAPECQVFRNTRAPARQQKPLCQSSRGITPPRDAETRTRGRSVSPRRRATAENARSTHKTRTRSLDTR